RRLGRARQIELNRPLAMTATVAAAAVLLGAVLYVGVLLGRSGARLEPAAQAAEGARRPEDPGRQLAAARRELQARLDALAGRVGRMNAHVIRLDALGRRLTEMAKLDKGEFDFDSEPAVGGPEGLIEGAVASAPDLSAMLDSLGRQIRDRERQLSVL